MSTLITSTVTDIDENIANQNHATRNRTPKLGYLKLTNILLFFKFCQFWKNFSNQISLV